MGCSLSGSGTNWVLGHSSGRSSALPPSSHLNFHFLAGISVAHCLSVWREKTRSSLYHFHFALADRSGFPTAVTQSPALCIPRTGSDLDNRPGVALFPTAVHIIYPPPVSVSCTREQSGALNTLSQGGSCTSQACHHFH